MNTLGHLDEGNPEELAADYAQPEVTVSRPERLRRLLRDGLHAHTANQFSAATHVAAPAVDERDCASHRSDHHSAMLHNVDYGR